MEVAIPKRIFTTMSVSVFFFNTDCCRAPPDPPRLQDRATPAPHGSTRCYRRKNGPSAKLGERGASKGVPLPPGDGLLGPREKKRIGEGGVSNIFGGVSLPGFFFVSSVWGFNCMEGVFSVDRALSSPPGGFCTPGDSG